MRVMLTSFGIEQSLSSSEERDSRSMFYRMPPVSFRRFSEAFLPDYELLLLCDRVVMDESSFGRLIDDRVGMYTEVADTFRALKTEGRVELVDYSSIVRDNQELLQRMLEYDIKILDQWVTPLRESLDIWTHFAYSYRELMEEHEHMTESHGERTEEQEAYNNHIVNRVLHSAIGNASSLYLMTDVALRSSRKRKLSEFRDPLRETLQAYLAYVNANLVIANELQTPFHDWQDFIPFYATKFLAVGKDEDEVHEQHQQVEKLFSVAFPDLAIRDTSSLLRALSDKRIEDLRTLISDAVVGKVDFDDQFAKSVLADVFQYERRASKFRNVLGYATLPVGFIPFVGTPAQKALEEGIGRPVEKKIRQKHRWFYMLSDIAGKQPR